MTTLNEKSDPRLYIKHHSFEGFFTNIKADEDKEKQKVVGVLQKYLSSKNGSARNDVLKEALSDLLMDDPSKVFFKITQHIADELSKIEDPESVARYIYHRYRYDVFPKKRLLDDFPPYVQVEPTSICNYRCVFCYQSNENFSKKSSGFMGSMSVELFKDVMDRLEGHVEFISLASRGEPTANQKLSAMLEYCVGKFLGLKLNTNASLLNEKTCHAILSGGINTVVFSADAAEEPMYSQMRVGGKLQNVLKKIEMFNKIKTRDYPQSKIITRVSGVKYNDAQEMSSMKKLWAGLVDQIAFVAYNPWENVYEAAPNNVQEPCSDLWRRMFIWYDGKINPCDTDYKSLLSVGNIKESTISKLWHSEHYQKLRGQHLKKERSQIYPCRGCVVI